MFAPMVCDSPRRLTGTRREPIDVFEVPRLRCIARHSLPNLLEATIVPLGLFYLVMWLAGVWGALVIALVWSYGAVANRVIRRRRVPGVLMLGAAAMTARTLIAAATGSVFVYFLQPTLGTVAVAGAFLVSVPLRRPLAARLAGDFCPLPDGFSAHPGVQRFFRRISLLWGLVYCVNAAGTLWLLASQPITTFLWVKSVASWALTGTAILASTLYFRRSMRRDGLEVRWGPRHAVGHGS
jgi:hypothetical protein